MMTRMQKVWNVVGIGMLLTLAVLFAGCASTTTVKKTIVDGDNQVATAQGEDEVVTKTTTTETSFGLNSGERAYYGTPVIITHPVYTQQVYRTEGVLVWGHDDCDCHGRRRWTHKRTTWKPVGNQGYVPVPNWLSVGTPNQGQVVSTWGQRALPNNPYALQVSSQGSNPRRNPVPAPKKWKRNSK